MGQGIYHSEMLPSLLLVQGQSKAEDRKMRKSRLSRCGAELEEAASLGTGGNIN